MDEVFSAAMSLLLVRSTNVI